MNLILFEKGELEAPLSYGDPRAAHLKKVLRREKGQEFDAGLVNGPRGKARITAEKAEGFEIEFRPVETEPPGLYPLTLCIGAVRPQTAKKVLREATALGVGNISFCGTEKGEKAYLSASVYDEKYYRPQLIEGAQQAFCTRLPEVKIFSTVREAFDSLPVSAASTENPETSFESIALDNYEAECSLGAYFKQQPRKVSPGKASRGTARVPGRIILWIGSERGWSAAERDLFRKKGTRLLSLGSRILRTETASLAAVSICLNEMGFLD